MMTITLGASIPLAPFLVPILLTTVGNCRHHIVDLSDNMHIKQAALPQIYQGFRLFRYSLSQNGNINKANKEDYSLIG